MLISGPKDVSAAMIPEESDAVYHIDERYIVPKTKDNLTTELKRELSSGWSLTAEQLNNLVDDADHAAIAFFAGDPIELDPRLADSKAGDALDSLIVALEKVGTLDDYLFGPVISCAPGLFPQRHDLARETIRDALNSVRIAHHKPKQGKPKSGGERVARAAFALVNSWKERTGHDPNESKLPPSALTFYDLLLPQLQIPTGVRVFRRDGHYDQLREAGKFAGPCLDVMLSAIRRLNRDN